MLDKNPSLSGNFNNIQAGTSGNLPTDSVDYNLEAGSKVKKIAMEVLYSS